MDETQSAKSDQGSNTTVEEESHDEEVDRGMLEADILSVARLDSVQHALHTHAKALALDRNAIRTSTIATAADDWNRLKEELERGLRAILSASCDQRVKVFHWMIMDLEREHSATEIIECFFDEAESQMNEAEGREKEIIAAVFGVTSSI